MATYGLLDSELDDAKRKRLHDELHGPFLTMGHRPPEDADAPSWWHGDEEAYESTMAVANALGRRRR